MVARGLQVHPDGKPRCYWAGSDEDYLDYHDTEWGYPVDDDQRLFESIAIPGNQLAVGLEGHYLIATGLVVRDLATPECVISH